MWMDKERKTYFGKHILLIKSLSWKEKKILVIFDTNSETNNISWLLDVFSQHRTLSKNTEFRAYKNVAFKHDDMRWTTSKINVYRESQWCHENSTSRL